MTCNSLGTSLKQVVRRDLRAAGKQALDHELGRAVGGHRKHCAAQQGDQE